MQESSKKLPQRKSQKRVFHVDLFMNGRLIQLFRVLFMAFIAYREFRVGKQFLSDQLWKSNSQKWVFASADA